MSKFDHLFLFQKLEIISLISWFFKSSNIYFFTFLIIDVWHCNKACSSLSSTSHPNGHYSEKISSFQVFNLLETGAFIIFIFVKIKMLSARS